MTIGESHKKDDMSHEMGTNTHGHFQPPSDLANNQTLKLLQQYTSSESLPSVCPCRPVAIARMRMNSMALNTKQKLGRDRLDCPVIYMLSDHPSHPPYYKTRSLFSASPRLCFTKVSACQASLCRACTTWPLKTSKAGHKHDISTRCTWVL